jgi:hypothetical protein
VGTQPFGRGVTGTISFDKSIKLKRCVIDRRNKQQQSNEYVQTLVFNVYTVYKVDLKVSEGSEDADPVQTLTIYLAPYLSQIEPDYEPNA